MAMQVGLLQWKEWWPVCLLTFTVSVASLMLRHYFIPITVHGHNNPSRFIKFTKYTMDTSHYRKGLTKHRVHRRRKVCPHAFFSQPQPYYSSSPPAPAFFSLPVPPPPPPSSAALSPPAMRVPGLQIRHKCPRLHHLPRPHRGR